MIQSVQSGYAAQSIQQTQKREEETSVQSPQSSGDQVTLSPEAMIASFFTGMGVDYTPGQKSISLEDLEAGLKKKTTEFQDRVNTLFLENGISTDPPVELTSDSEGNIRVKGDHPDKEKIEQLFEDNPELANDFRGISGLSSLVKAGKEYVEFAKEYEKDPQAAVAKYSHLFDALKDEEFSMIFGGAQSDDVA